MANFKRKRPKTASVAFSSRGHWLRHWPRWWDVVFHTRPTRRLQQGLLRDIAAGRRDPDDDAAFPLGNHKPHHYYW